MRARVRRRRKRREHLASELELMPMLNVFISIIPLLLLSAAFVPVSVIETTLPAQADIIEETPEAPVDLAVRILPEAWSLEVNGEVWQMVPRASGQTASEELNRALGGLAVEHQGHEEIRVISLPTTRYEDIVTVMDAARAAGMPHAALAAGGS